MENYDLTTKDDDIFTYNDVHSESIKKKKGIKKILITLTTLIVIFGIAISVITYLRTDEPGYAKYAGKYNFYYGYVMYGISNFEMLTEQYEYNYIKLNLDGTFHIHNKTKLNSIETSLKGEWTVIENYFENNNHRLIITTISNNGTATKEYYEISNYTITFEIETGPYQKILMLYSKELQFL